MSVHWCKVSKKVLNLSVPKRNSIPKKLKSHGTKYT